MYNRTRKFYELTDEGTVLLMDSDKVSWNTNYSKHLGFKTFTDNSDTYYVSCIFVPFALSEINNSEPKLFELAIFKNEELELNFLYSSFEECMENYFKIDTLESLNEFVTNGKIMKRICN